MSSTKPLTAAQRKKVTALYCNEGRGAETIARVLDVPHSVVALFIARESLVRGTPPIAAVKPLTQAQSDRVRTLYTVDGRGLETIARFLSVPLAAVEMYVVGEALVRGKAAATVQQGETLEAQLLRVQLAKEEKEMLQAAAGERSLRATLERLVKETAQLFPTVPAYVQPPAIDDSDEETLVLMLSDWHLYETIDPERVRDFNAYNSKIAGTRVHTIVHSLISIKRKMERGGWRFPRLVVGLNGDIISGSIHEVERHSDAPSVVHAVYGAGLLVAQALRDLAAEFETVEVFCTSGNHGRLPDARRMQQKDPQRSWDTLIAWFAKEHLSALGDRIRFYVPNAYSVMFEVEGWNFLQTHGHDVKSWNSIPWYGINRYVGNINALESSRGVTVHHYLFGHFHTATSLPHAAGESFINGSLIGGSEFSVNALGKSDKPVQWLLGVHREHGVTHRWPLIANTHHEGSYAMRPWLSAK